MNEKAVAIKKILRESGMGSGESEHFAKSLEAMGFELEDEKDAPILHIQSTPESFSSNKDKGRE